jgi:hypothetical protein
MFMKVLADFVIAFSNFNVQVILYYSTLFFWIPDTARVVNVLNIFFVNLK